MSKFKSVARSKNRSISCFGSYCEGCFEKQHLIDQMGEYITSLEDRLKYREQKDREPFFGSSTPSSRLPFKENTLEENMKKKGGAKLGHQGNGRKKLQEAQLMK